MQGFNIAYSLKEAVELFQSIHGVSGSKGAAHTKGLRLTVAFIISLFADNVVNKSVINLAY